MQSHTFPLGRGYNRGMFMFTRPAIFHVLTDEGVAAQFLRAVADDIEQARAFTSKGSAVDLEAIQHLMEHPAPVVALEKADGGAFRRGPGLRTRSVLLQSCILHLHMVEEPDEYGPWKIYGVDKENR